MGSIAEEYRSSLNDLNFNSKPLINMLTMLADENKKHASLIVDAIMNHIDSVPAEIKLPGLYLIDSIMKNIGDQYLKIFCQHIVTIFSSVFEKVDESTRSLMFKLRQTWTEILPNKVLHNLDVRVKKLDPAWPITAKYYKKILVNPEFLEKPVEKKPENVGETSSIKIEESKIKLKQAEVLKQLQAKQKQLLQLELKKQQMAKQHQKIPPVIPSTSLTSPKQIHVRDPRMVKINVPQNVPSLKKNTVPIKSSIQENRCTSLVSDISVQEKLALPSKTQVLPQIKQCDSNASRESLSEPNDETSKELSPEKNCALKFKNDKNMANKDKLVSVSKGKNNEDTRSNSSRNSMSTVRTTVMSSKSKLDCDKADMNCQDLPRRPKNVSKRKSPVLGCNKLSHVNTNASVDATKKKVPNQKTFKKNEKMKSFSDFDLRRKINMNRDEPAKSVSIEGEKTKKDIKTLVEPLGTSKYPIKKNDIEPVLSDIKCISQKDEDLRRLPLIKTEEVESKRIPKREIEASDFSGLEVDKDDIPRKKIKCENNENRNPDSRTGSPFLFGNEDQDLRHSDYPSAKDGNLNDWSQYKASHPNAYSPYPARQEYYGEKFRSRKHQFFSSKYYYPTQNERFPSFRYARGRYFGRGNYHQGNFPRANRGRSFGNSAFDAFMFDSHTVLQQTEEKYRTGRISESAYMELRRDLQKLVQNSEYQFFRNEQSNSERSHQFERNSEVAIPREHEGNMHAMPTIQDSHIGLQMVKPFVLDNKERFIHFVDDKALILVDNNEPREITFKNEQRDVRIEGLAEPLTLGFDGKSVEFEVDGRRNILRFGTPGRELFINNHPYEAQFGGPPITVRLRNEHGYKVQLSGPPPQVIIGDVPQYELFDKYHNNMTAHKHAFKEEINHSKNDLKVETQHIMPAVSSSLQDVDMRMQPETVPHADMLDKDRPFYDQDMKDIDWRHIPFSDNQEHDKSVSRVFEGGVSKDDTMWSEEDIKTVKFLDDRQNMPRRFVPKNRLPSGWQISTYCINENQYSKQDKSIWTFRDYRNVRQTTEVPYPEESYEASKVPMQHFNDQVEHFRDSKDNHHNLPFPKRAPYQSNQSNNQDLRASSETWPNTYKGRPLNQSLSSFRPSSKALLPLPDFPPHYPSLIGSALPQSVDATDVPASFGTNEESFKDFPGLKNVSSSEGEPSSSSTSNLKVDIESLLQKLVAAGIINTKPDEDAVEETLDTPVPETPDTKEASEHSEEIPVIGLTAENLKVHHIGVISALHKGLQCATCGMRFKDLKGDQYSHHLDWHFRMNRREKDGAKKAISRRWYYELEDWLQFEEFEDFEIRVPSYFELQAQDNSQQEITEVPAIISVPATSDDEETCPVCSEKFQLFWVEDEEEWHFRDAMRHDNVTYHPACYEDFKKMRNIEKTIKEDENSSTCSQDIEEDIHIFMNSLLDGVLEDLSKDHQIVNATEARFGETEDSMDVNEISMDEGRNSMNENQNFMDENQNSTDEIRNSTDEIQKPENDHSEEEILEGKPGEEEIIGLISESDVEMDAEFPRTDAKMVVMQSGGITLKVKAESLQCHSPLNHSEKQTKQEDDNKPVEDEDIDIDFRPPTPDPHFEVRPLVSRGRELSGLCSIM